MSTPLLRSDVPEGGAPPLDAEALEELGAFLAQADLIGRGGIMTDLDGTAVLEREGSVVIPDIVSGSSRTSRGSAAASRSTRCGFR